MRKVERPLTWVQEKIQKHKVEKLHNGTPSPPVLRGGASLYDPDNYQTVEGASGLEVVTRRVPLPPPADLRSMGVETWFGIVPMRWLYEANKLGPNAFRVGMAILSQVYAHRFPKNKDGNFQYRKVKPNHHTITLASKYWAALPEYICKKRAVYIRELMEAKLVGCEIQKGRSIKVTVFVDHSWLGPEEVEPLELNDEPCCLLGEYEVHYHHEGTATTTEGG